MASEIEPLLGATTCSEHGKRQQREEALGYLYVVLSAFAFLSMASTVHYLVAFRQMHVGSIIMVRGATQAVIALLASLLVVGMRAVFSMPLKHLPLLVARAFMGGLCISLGYHALSMIPIGVVFSLFFTYPIITAFLSTALLGERMSKREAACSLLVFFGVLLVSNPSLSMPSELPRRYLVGCFLILLSAPMAAGETICVRYLGKRVHFLNHVFILGCATAMCGAVMGRGTLPELQSDPKSIAIGLVAGAFGFCGQALINKGFQMCRAGTGTILRAVDVPLSYISGVLFFSEIPEALSLVGSAIVVLATTFVAVGGAK